jgi:hypothetical protein
MSRLGPLTYNVGKVTEWSNSMSLVGVKVGNENRIGMSHLGPLTYNVGKVTE